VKINYKNKLVYANLFFGVVWLINGIYQVFFEENPNWFDSIWLLLSATYFVLFYVQKYKSYLTIEGGLIKENWPFGKKISIADITEIKYFVGDYIVKTDTKELTINTQLVHGNSVVDLKAALEKLTVKSV
jgi:hypothetical protein